MLTDMVLASADNSMLRLGAGPTSVSGVGRLGQHLGGGPPRHWDTVTHPPTRTGREICAGSGGGGDREAARKD